MLRNFFFLYLLITTSLAFSASEVAQTITYQGRLFNAAGTAPSTDNVDFILSIYAPTGNDCLLYQETQSQDLSVTNGLFSFQIGSFTGAGKRTASDPTLTMAQVFSSRAVQIRAAGANCAAGYTPAAGDGRRLRVSISRNAGAYSDLTPDQTLNSSATSIVAQTLQGYTPSNFVMSSSNITQANVESLVDGSDATTLHHHDGRYFVPSSSSSQNLGSAGAYTLGAIGIGTSSPASKIHVNAAPSASSNYGTFSLGSGAFNGSTAGFFTGSAAGTSMAVNEATGYLGSLLDLQVAGVSSLKAEKSSLTLGPSMENGGLYFTDSQASIRRDSDVLSTKSPGGNKTGRDSTLGWLYQFDSASILTSGTGYYSSYLDSFAPTSGSAVYGTMRLAPTINQTGGASGVTRGLYVAPTLTAAADWRSIDLANNAGFGVYQSGASANNYFAGKVGIGTSTPDASLLILGADSGATKSFEVLNSSSQVLISAMNNKTLSLNSTSGTGDTNIGTTNGAVTFNNGYNNTFNRNSLELYSGGSQNTIQGFNADKGIAIGYSQTITNPNPGTTFSVKGRGATSSTYGLKIHDSTGSSNSLVVRDDGFVGIGTDAPTQKLHVVGDLVVNQQSGRTMTFSSGGSDASIRVAGGNALDVYPNMFFRINNSVSSVVHNFAARNGIDQSARLGGVMVTNDTAANVQITSWQAAKKGLIVQGVASQTANLQEWQNSTGTSVASVDKDGDITTVGCVTYSSGTSGVCDSDERLKSHIRDFDLGLKVILGIKPKYYRYNGLGGRDKDKMDRLGLIAQDLEKVAPSLVHTKEIKLRPNDKKTTKIKAVDYSGLTYMLVNAVQELDTKNNQKQKEFDKKIAELEQENKILKDRLDKFEKLIRAPASSFKIKAKKHSRSQN